MGVAIQVLCSSLMCCVCMCVGIMFAWPSSTLKLFTSPQSPLQRAMTAGEAALYGAMCSLGALAGTPAAAVLLDRVGRKNTCIVFSCLTVASWTLISLCGRVEAVLCGACVCGAAGGVFVAAPVYVAEVCAASVRGPLASCTMVFYAIGMLLSYVMGATLKYQSVTYANLGISVAVTGALALLRESPTYLMSKGREEEAIKSISFYHRVKPNSKEMQEQLSIIRQSLNPELDDASPEEEQLNAAKQPDTSQLSVWQFLKQSRSTRRGLWLSLALLTASILQGMVVLQVFAEPLLARALPAASPAAASAALAATTVLVGLVAALLTERAGRRPLLIYSTLVAGASCALLGVQLQLRWGPDWLVATNIGLFTVVYTLGGATVPYVVVAEVFLPQVRSVLSMVVMEWTWFSNYIILVIFPPLLDAIGLGPCFYIFSAVSFCTAVYGIYYLPETKGLTVYEIQGKLYSKKERRLTKD